MEYKYKCIYDDPFTGKEETYIKDNETVNDALIQHAIKVFDNFPDIYKILFTLDYPSYFSVERLRKKDEI